MVKNFRALSGLLLFLLALIPVDSFCSEPLKIGLSQIPENLNYLSQNNLAAKLLRSFSTQTLLRMVPPAVSPAGFELVLADHYSVSHDYSEIQFRLRAGVYTHSSREFSAQDVLESLKACEALSAHASTVLISGLEKSEPGQLKKHQWIKIQLNDSASAARSNKVRSVLESLASCPIYSMREARIFGAQSGTGTNLVASGPYILQSFKDGKGFTLMKSELFRGADRAPSSVELRAISNPLDGLSALRLGNIFMLFTEDPGAKAAALGDETLVVTRCLDSTLIHRRNLQFACNYGLDVLSIKYIG